MNLQGLERRILGNVLPHPVIVAGGVYKTAAHVGLVCDTDVIPEWGSITTDPRPGNGGRDYYAEYRDVPHQGRVLIRTLNSLGLPNPGMKHVEKHAADLLKRYEDAEKPLILNVSGENADDLLELVERAIAAGFKMIVMNGACPNGANSDGSRIPILCWDKASVAYFFAECDRRFSGSRAVLLWKISNGITEELLEFNTLAVLNSFACQGIINGNTIPNVGLTLPDGEPAIKTTNGFTKGGLAGPAIQMSALRQTSYSASALRHTKVAVACGGISTARHVLLALACGAWAVEVNSAFREAGERPKFITDLLVELVDLFEKRA